MDISTVILNNVNNAITSIYEKNDTSPASEVPSRNAKLFKHWKNSVTLIPGISRYSKRNIANFNRCRKHFSNIYHPFSTKKKIHQTKNRTPLT